MRIRILQRLISIGAVAVLSGSLLTIPAHSYTKFYGDAASNTYTGESSMQEINMGLRHKTLDFHAFVRTEFYDTHGSAAQYSYSIRGTRVGTGIKHWFADGCITGGVSVAQIVDGPDTGRSDFRAGFAGYNKQVSGRCLKEMYGEAFWVSLADDCFATLRLRIGAVPVSSLWFYTVAQVWKSASGYNAADNRAELGIGTAYKIRDWGSVNFELRSGYTFSGNVDKRAYINPTLIISSGF